MENKTTENVELLRGNPKKALIKLAIPMILSLVIVSFNNIIDRIWVAGIGSDPLAAIGFFAPLFFVIIGIGNGIGAGANSLISRYIGAKDYKSASNSALHSLIIGLLLSIIIPLIMVPFLDDILILMGAVDVLQLTYDYGVILLIGSFAIIFNMMLSSQLRAEGDVKRSTLIMILGDLLNMVFDPIFIYMLKLGISGAAIATVIANAIPILLAAYWLFIKKDTYLDYSLRNFNYNFSLIKRILEVGIPASIEQLIMSFVNIILNWMLSIVAGTTIIAAFSVSFTLLEIGMMPGLAIGTAAITVAGVAYGARNYENLKITSRYALQINMIVCILITIIMYLFAPQLAVLFSYSQSSAALYPILVHSLRILCFFILVAPAGAICASIFQGMGKGTISLLLTVIREFLFVIVLTYLSGIVLGLGADGIYISFIIAVGLGSLLSVISIEYYIKKISEKQL